MLGQEKPQDFELIELLVREVAGVSRSGPSTSAQQKSDFESFKARFQSYIDQIPSYLHSVGKEGFFPHFFLGSFSILPDTEIAGKLGIKKVYFRFDTPKTLKIVVVQNDQIKKDTDVIRVAREEKSIGLFSISEHDGPGHQFTSGELEYILKENLHPDIKKEERTNTVRGIKDRVKGRIKSKLVQINRSENSISVEMQDKEIVDSAASHKFHEIKKEEEIWKDPEDNTKTRPEDYIAELTDPNVEEVKKSSGKVLSKISEVHSKYKGSFAYADQAREAAHHGFIAGALVNFRYRYNLRVYLEQFAGRGYADIVLVPRGKDRSLNAVPIIIELKAATKEELKELEKGGKVKDGSQTTPAIALEQAKDYAKGFQPNTMRVLTVSDNVLCVGLNLDSAEGEKFSMHISPPADRKPARPTIQKLLEVTSSWSGEESAIADLKKEIKQPLERIYHTFPGTPEKGGNYFSRFLLGQLLLADKFVDIDLEKSVFLYNEYPLASSTRLGPKSTGRPVTTFMLTKGNQGQDKEVFIFHIREGGKGEFSEKKIPINLPKVGKITEVCISLQEERKSDFFNVEQVNRYNSLNEYKQGKSFFDGEWKNIPYPAELKEKFDAVLESQLVSSQDRSQSIGKYKELFGKLGEGILSFKSLIEKEAHFQAVFHGAFSHYSDIKLGESQENRALVLTEFQTGRGKRIDMVVHGIKFANQASSAKEYDPVGLELKGPRKGTTTDELKNEANEQITDEYTKGVTYKTLTDGKEVDFVGVVFDKGASNADSLILMSKDEFASIKVIHSSIFSFSQQQPGKRFDPNSCVGQSSRSKRSINNCLFSRDDVEKFSKGKVDENNVDKIVIDSEKFLTYVKSSKDEGKNAQLREFIENKNIEGDYKYLVDKVIRDQGYERYIQNERIKDLYGDVLQQNSGLTKNPKLKSRLMNAAGGIQLIRGIHGAIVSCKDGTATDCGLNLGGIGWSFASQPIENVMVKIAPKVVTSAEKVVGKIIPGTLGKQTKFVVRVAGVKFGSTIAKGAAGAVAGVFDIIDIGISANNLIDCKNRENSDNPCGEKEIRDNIASISFSGVSFVSGVALTAAGMPVIGIGVGFGLMVGYGVYSGISNIVEYEKRYDTTHGENWSIFWRTILFQDMASDVQHLADRRNTVDSLAKEVRKALNKAPNSVVAYGVGLGEVSGNTLRPDYAKILMDKEDTNTEDLSRVIPDRIPGASRICLPKVTGQDYEKGITSSVQPPLYYCENAMVISHDSRVGMEQSGKTIVYDLQNVDNGVIVGSNKWNNNFLIYPGTTKITGGNNVANRFVLVNNPSFLGKIIGGSNSINILDLSQLAEDKVTGVIDYRFKPRAYGQLKIRINNRLLIDDYVSNNLFNYHYIGRQDKVDEILCMGYSEHFTESDSRDVIIDSGGGFNRNREDVVENCRKVIISPYTTVKGRKSNYTFYVKVANYKGRGLYSEINVDGTGTVVFPEIDLLSDCDQITYSKESNTLSLKINLGQNNQFTLDVRNYVEQSSNKPHFVLIDKNGSNIVPKIERSDSATIKINSFELHSEHSLGKFKDVENHYKKILNNNKDYKVLSVIRGKTQNQNDSEVPHMVFGSSGDDVINFDQGTMFARGGKGSDVYVITDDINNKEVKIDNNSDDEKIDTLFMPEVEKDFSIQQCDLYLKYNNSNIRVKNYLQDHNHRHFIIMNKKGEAFIPNIQSMSCSSSGKGKLVPFLRATQTQNMFLLPKDFADDHVVIDSRLEDIKKYKDKDDLLIIRESEIPFIIRIEGFYTDRSKWENISYSLWNNNDLFPSPELLGNVDNVMKYEDKLRDDYERIVKEYIIDFSNSIRIEHNQKLERNISTFVGQDKERIGVMILKNIAPNQIEVSSSGTDLIFRDKRSNHTVNIKGWNNSKSYRISTLEFDLDLEPITIRRLDRFSLYEVGKIQSLIDIASEIYQNKSEYTPKVETDFKCLISVDGFERENKEQTYQCLGFSSLQDQINFTENLCSKEQIEEFTSEIPNNIEVLSLLIKLHNDLLLNSYYKSIIDKCNDLMITSKPKVSKLLFLVVGDPHRFKFLLDNGANVEIKDDNGRTLLNAAASNGNLDTAQLVFDKIRAKNNDPYKMMKMVDVLKKEIINQADTAANVKKWANSFIEELRYSIKSVAKEKLKDGMLRNRYSSVNELANEIYKSDGKLFDDTIRGVINDVYGKVDTKKILSCVQSHGYIGQMISGYIAVFDAMQKSGDLNDSAIFKLAYYIKEAMKMENYPNVSFEKRHNLKKLKGRLPESVRNAVFASEVCIKNIDHNEYLYAASNDFSYDDDRRRVFTWIPKDEKNDKFRWEIKLDGDNFNIVNAGFNEYLYGAVDHFNYDNERRKVFTWIPGGRVRRDTWKIEPIGSSCYIMNVELNEYLYASVDHFNYDDERRRVFTWIPKNSKSDQFKWNIEDCGSTIRKVRDVINQGVDTHTRDSNDETSLHMTIQQSNADTGFHSNIVRVPRQAKSNSEISVYYIKGVEDEGRRVQINLASAVKATGKFQGLANKIVLNQETIRHLNKVREVSGILMHGMIAKNALADFLSGDYTGVAINLGFIAGGRGLTKIVKVVNAKGIDFITDGKLLLGRSLKTASPFLARSTSAFVVYDLVNQIKELERGDKDALIPVIGDSIYLGTDAAEIGIEVAEAFGVLEGVSSVTGPIGATIGAVVFIGTDIYMSVRRVGKINEIVHLTGGEKIIEGLRAFVGIKPEQYIEELMEKKQLNDQLVKQGLEYLKEHNNIQRYVFPTKRSVVDSCETFTREIVGMKGHFMVLEKERCKVKIQDDLDNVAFFDKEVNNVIYNRAKPDAPDEGRLFCLPTGPIRPESGGENAYLCHDTIGLDYPANRIGNHTLIALGKGKDRAVGFKYSPNVFLVDDGDKDFTGGDKDDLFILVGNRVTGRLDGGGGNNTLNLAEFSLNENLNIKPDSRKNDSSISSSSNDIRIKNMNIIYGRKGKQDIVDCGCDVRYIDGQGGLSNNTPDNITIPYCYRPSEKKVIVRPSTEINNLDQSSNGNFDYIILPDKGKANINIEPDFSLARQRKHNFLFNYTLFDLASVDIKNIKDINHWHAGYRNMTHTIRNVTFSFLSTLSKGKSINEKFDITISDIPANASYILSDNTEIKIGKNNLYAMHSTDKTIDEIVENYPTIADHLRMSLFISTKNETVVMGHGNHDIINNNFLQKSHLIGSGGENVYVVTSGHEILDIENLPIPEVIIYDDFNKKNSLKDTLDLRQLVRQVNGDLSIEPISKIIEDRNDLLIKLSISAIALEQDVITVRLKDAFVNNWYKELQVILNNAPMKISSELELKLLPLIFDKDKEIIIVTPQDIEEKEELIISKEAGQYTFLYSGYDLMITNVLNADMETNKFCTIYLKDFYKQPKMETLSIEFTDKKILLSDEIDQINNADSFRDKLMSENHIAQLNEKLLIAAKECNLGKIIDLVNQCANVSTTDSNKWTPLHWTASKNCSSEVGYLIKQGANIDAKNDINRTPTHLAARNCHSSVVLSLINGRADVDARDKDGKTPSDLAFWQKRLNVTSGQECDQTIEHLEKLNQEREKPVQRKRRHHHGDHSRHHLSRKPLAIDLGDQPEIATSSGARPPSWINDLFGWIKGSLGGLFYSRAALSEEASNTASSIPQVDEQFAKASVSSSSSTSTTLPSDGTDKKQENGGFFRDNIDYVNANIKQMRERQTPVKFKPSGGNTILEMGDHYLSQVDFNGTIMLLDLLIRKVTGQKYISTVDQSISPLEAQGYALNITKGFERVVEQAGLKSDVSMHRLNIDYVRMQEEIAEKVMSGKFNEISGILNSYVEKACPGREAGCPGKLSPKKFDKFMIQFNSRLNIVLNQSIEQILHNRDGRLEVDDAKQMSLEPQSYLSNASVHSHSKVSTCLSEIGVTKLGVNLNR